MVPPYKKMYFRLFNAITDALRLMEGQDYSHAQIILMLAQQQMEELYIESGEKETHPLRGLASSPQGRP